MARLILAQAELHLFWLHPRRPKHLLLQHKVFRVHTEDEEASAATHAVAATSAAVSSGPQPSGEGAADDLTSAVAAVELGKTQAYDAVQQLEALKQERQRKNQ